MGQRYNRGTWIGLVTALILWLLIVRPAIAVAVGYGGGLSLPLMVIAGAFGAVGGGIGTQIWSALHDGPRRGP